MGPQQKQPSPTSLTSVDCPPPNDHLMPTFTSHNKTQLNPNDNGVAHVLISSISLVWEKFTKIKSLCGTRHCAINHEVIKKNTKWHPVSKERNGFLKTKIKGQTFSV